AGVLNVDRMWQINVAGTARVMEAITEANRDVAVVEKFIFPSSVSAYGSDLPRLVTEEFPLGAHTLPYAIHKMESDRVVQQRAPSLRGCSVYMLRPHILAGARLMRVPTKSAFRAMLKFLWKAGISAIPPEAVPYMAGEYIMNTDGLRNFLGSKYEDVMRYTISDAFADCFRAEQQAAAQRSAG